MLLACCLLLAKAGAAPVDWPVLVDEPVAQDSRTQNKTRQERVFARNEPALRKLAAIDRAEASAYALLRLKDLHTPFALRLLYAPLLALWNVQEGRTFLIQALVNSADPHFADTVWTVGHLPDEWAKVAGMANPDMAWTEDVMVAVLMDRTRVPVAEEWQNLFPVDRDSVEARELGMNLGRFGESLAVLRSKEIAPLLLDWMQSKSPPIDLTPFLYSLGKCQGNPRAENYVLSRLAKHEGDYGVAVTAAVNLHLGRAKPLLMKQLADPRTYDGLMKLGDARLVRELRASLPKLKKEDQPRLELLIIRLQEHDPVPAVMTYASDATCPARREALAWIDTTADPRTVRALGHILQNDSDPYAREVALRVLVRIKNRAAVGALINALGDDAAAVGRLVPAPDDAAHAQILASLKEITHQDFGYNREKWLAWYNGGK